MNEGRKEEMRKEPADRRMKESMSQRRDGGYKEKTRNEITNK